MKSKENDIKKKLYKINGYCTRFSCTDQSKEKNSQVPIGNGDVDWEDFFEAAKIGGVKNFFVEMSPEKFEPSAKYLLKV